MAPTSGGQYHWVSMLAPPGARKFLGYLTGWLALTGWQALVASGGYLTGTMIQGLILLTHPAYASVMQNWHGTLLFWAVILFGYTINSAIGALLAKFEGLVLVVHLLGFLGILLPLALLSDHGDSAAVFNNFYNLGDWQTQGLSFCIGILGNVFAFLGADGAIHVSPCSKEAAFPLLRLCADGGRDPQRPPCHPPISPGRPDDQRDAWLRDAHRHFVLRGSRRHRSRADGEPSLPFYGHLPQRRRVYSGRDCNVFRRGSDGIQCHDRLHRLDLAIVLGLCPRPWPSWI